MRISMRRRAVIPALAATAATVVVTAGAAAAVETDTVASFGRGLLWSLSLMTTVGFIGDPPRTDAGAILSVILMVAGFLLLALVSAALASLFVRDDERAFEAQERADVAELIAEIQGLRRDLAARGAVPAQQALRTDPVPEPRPISP